VKVSRGQPSAAPLRGLPLAGQKYSVLGEEPFHRMIALERKRTERSGQPFVLMLLDGGECLPSDRNGRILSKILSALSLSTRDTDVTGWYKDHSIVGVLFTDISADDRESILGTMMARVSQTLQNSLNLEKFEQIGISMHVFPEEWDQESTHGNPALYPDFANRDQGRKIAHITKRAMDIVGSARGGRFSSARSALASSARASLS
jgi:hypothetical protein